MPLVEIDEKKNSSSKKKRIFDFLRREGLLEERGAGTLLIHYNDGGITKVSDHKDVLK